MMKGDHNCIYGVVEDQTRCAVIFKFFKGQRSRKFYGQSFYLPIVHQGPHLFFFSLFFKYMKRIRITCVCVCLCVAALSRRDFTIYLLFWSFGKHGSSLPSHQQDIWEVYFSKLSVVRKASLNGLTFARKPAITASLVTVSSWVPSLVRQAGVFHYHSRWAFPGRC